MFANEQFTVSELTFGAFLYHAPEGVHHFLQAVANTEDRNIVFVNQVPNLWIQMGSSGFINAGWPSAEDDCARVEVCNEIRTNGACAKFGENVEFARPATDQVTVLGAEIDHENFV